LAAGKRAGEGGIFTRDQTPGKVLAMDWMDSEHSHAMNAWAFSFNRNSFKYLRAVLRWSHVGA
jgi:hypothetical protein